MKIQQVQEFSLFDRRKEQLVIVHFRRIDDYFLMEKRAQDGKVVDSEKVAESFAQTVLEQALICLPKSDIEIVRRSTGTVFNYPTPHV
jgi:hypothetical protein